MWLQVQCDLFNRRMLSKLSAQESPKLAQDPRFPDPFPIEQELLDMFFHLSDNSIVTLYNPLAHLSTQYVRAPVKEDNYQVTDEKGHVVGSELVPVPWQVLALEFRNNETQLELDFKASVKKMLFTTLRRSIKKKQEEEVPYDLKRFTL